MDNPSYVCGNFNHSKMIDAEAKLLLKKLNEAFASKNLEKFKMLLQRPIRKSLSTPSHDGDESSKAENQNFFQRLNMFRNFSFRMQSGDEITNGNYQQKLAYNDLLSQKILCYRKVRADLSLLEKILREPESGEFIAFVWNDCDFWRDSASLTTVNEQGKLLMDFIIESGDDGNLFVFLIHDLKDRTVDSSSNKNYFLKIKKDQFQRISGISLFSQLYKIVTADPTKANYCLIILNEILKEVKEITDIRRDVLVDTVLAMSGKIKHDILKLLMKFWRINSKDYHFYRNAFCEASPFFKLYIALKELDEDEFEDSFCEYLDYMRQHYRDDFNEKLQEDSNLLLTFALNHGLKKAMQILIKCYSVDVNKVNDSSDVSIINNEYAMLKLLEKGYYLGYEDEEINKDGNWINAKVFKQFLDSRVTTTNGNASTVNRDDDRGIQIDYTFLISPDIRPVTMSKNEDGQRLIFNPGMAPLEWLLSNEKLRHLITHPVLSTFINLKSHKFSQIYSLNLYMFCVFYVLPFMLVFIHYDPQDETDVMKIMIPAVIATFYLTIRESIQFFWIIDNKIEYFKKKSNKLEMLMIFSSWWLLIALFTHKYHSYQVSSAFIILFGAIELLSILPYSSLSIYMFMLKEVTITFLKFFTIFILIILAFTFSFYAILKPIKHIHEKHLFNETLSLTSNESVFKNFEHPFTSFIKTILMFAGDFSVDPYKLDSFWKQSIFLCFVLTAFILYNLINGLAISDIQKLKDDAEFLNLKQRIRTTVDCEKISCNLFWKLCGTKKVEKTSLKDVEKNIATDKNLTTDQNLNCLERSAKNILKFMVNRYVFLHKMDNLFIDLKHKSIFYRIQQRREPILRMMNGKVKSYSLDDECYERLVAILKRKDKTGEDTGEKIMAMEREVKILVEQMEQMKSILSDITNKLNCN